MTSTEHPQDDNNNDAIEETVNPLQNLLHPEVSCDSLVTAPLDQTLVVDGNEEVPPQPQQRRRQDVEVTQNDQNNQNNNRPDFEMGDHVYQWCSVWGIPAVFAHHGIVLNVFFHQESNEWRLRVADFSLGNAQDDDDDDNHQNNNNKNNDGWDSVHAPRKKSFSSSGSGSKNGHSRIRTYETDPALWKKVQYQAGFWRKHLSRGGTATSAVSDPPGMVRARVQFLLDAATDRLPPYRLVQSNCECVAVWCKTGTWATLQATSWLSAAAAGQVKSTATLVGAAASTTVTVPAAGLWGWLGYTSQASLLSTQPWLLPALAAYGVVSVGGPALWLAMAQRQWKKTTLEMNTAFWNSAIEHPDVFVEYITYWSSMAAGEQPEEPTTIQKQQQQQGTNPAAPPTTSCLPVTAMQQLPLAAVEKLSHVQQEHLRRQRETEPTTQVPSQEASEG